VARARYIEDHVEEVSLHGVNQYVLLGSGLDTFAQRKPEIASRLKIFEVEKSSTLEWKRHRLQELGFSFQAGLKYVPVNFEAGTTWWEQLLKSGFNPAEKAIVTSVGVSMYLTKDAIAKTFENMNGLASGSKFIMTFMLPLELVDPEDRLGYERSLKGAQASGTPFISFFSPPEMLQFAASFGFKKTEHFSTKDLTQKYFRERADGLKPSSGEEFLIVTL
jgi:methyltransferase (TIGR00027 family)